MYNHTPKDYECSFCKFAKGVETEFNKLSDIVYQDKNVISFISPKWWMNNPGNVIVIPRKHYENLYDIPDILLAKVHIMVKRIALAIKSEYKSEGTSVRQHNEPAGNQDLWHFHIHVFPRYKNDRLYQNHDKKRFVTVEERKPYAQKLKRYFDTEES